MTVIIPIHTVSELNVREHHMARYRRRKGQRQAAYALVRSRLPSCFEPDWPMVVTLTRIAPRRLDAHDGLPASLKAVVDGIADALGIDDGSASVAWVYAQRKGAAKEYAVEVTIEQAREVDRG